MRRQHIVMTIICFLVCMQIEADSGPTNRIIVQFKENMKESYLSHLTSAARSPGFPIPHKTEMLTKEHIISKMKKRYKRSDDRDLESINKTLDELSDVMVFSYEKLEPEEMDVLLLSMNEDPGIVYAEPDVYIKGCYTPDDQFFHEQWNMVRIAADRVWDHTTGSAGIIVAVIDSGVDYTHPDLFQNIIQGYDFVNDDNEPYDDYYPGYHGTHISGIIAAKGNNGTGVAGTGWNIKILPLKVLDRNLSGYLSDGVEAIDYAIANGAHVINASLGTYTNNITFQNAITRARNAGIIVVSAAGNGGDDTIGDDNDRIPFYPASYNSDNIIAVANSVEQNDALDSSSNFGLNTVDLAAPGMEIYSTMGSGVYGYKYGTSIATPHVTGAVAMILSVYPDMDYRSVINAILDNVDTVPSYAGKIKSGGRLNIYKALTAIGGQLPVNTPLPEPLPATIPEPIIDLKVKYRCGDIQETSRTIKPHLKIVNMEPSPLVLQDIVVRYFYTREGSAHQQSSIDYADINSSYTAALFYNGYCDIGFSSSAGDIRFEPYSEITIELSITNIDGSNYDQTNDYSFDPSYSDYDDYEQIVLYYGDKTVWGKLPEGSYPAPTQGPQSTPSPAPVPTQTPMPGAGDVRIVPQQTSVFINQTFSVEIHVDTGYQMIAAYGIDLSFTSGVISVDASKGNNGVEAGPDGFVAAANISESGMLKTSGFDATGKGPGRDLHLLTICFTAGPYEGNTPLNLAINTLVDENTDVIGIPSSINGSVTVCTYLKGDVNHNGAIEIVDALIVAQYYVGLNPPSFTAPLEAGDANCNDTIDIVDALLIAQYYVGLIDQFCLG
jgi:hypothetical protein